MKVRVFLFIVSLMLVGKSLAGGNLINGVDPSDPSNPIEQRWDARMFPIVWEFNELGYLGSTRN